ncbi:Delta(24)-sterol reductase-like protein [Hapsidospora chrysogenum ATCC 11550]|uniref:Delta(24)-sterol reductase n=1 Tax=Hapsidospora chrysogenum (strain ATCC 11550 / CBS 779.69 / DSM 880 / IAM 14645 / JCM 23072 / IMI 49137) TaxID=857340 RepID=A0A086SX52_HAPC1|nr:Delta(24)-sterol reductase-like protein [Hapsidospora chrysogenum ATCC 11550]
MDAHNAIVAKVAERVKHFHTTMKPFRIYHGSTNSTRPSHRRADNTVDTSKLNKVLSVDTDKMTATAEPNVPLGDLVAATLKRGLLPPVVMEFPTITVGGGFSGSSGESSSFRHGAFEANIESIEIVLPDGTVERASRTEKPDLLWGAASAFGTIGVVTLVEVRLRPAKPFVELRYIHCKTPEDYVGVIHAESAKEDVEFIDGIVYSRDSTIICSGRFADTVPSGKKPVGFTARRDPWFYLHAQGREKKLRGLGKAEDEQLTDFIPVTDYLFRYNRAGFWTARYAFKYFLTPFNRVTRAALDRFMHTSVMYHAMHKSGLHDYYVIQDVGVPYSKAPDFHRWLDDTYKLYPIWLCPLRIRRDAPDSGHGLHAEFADPATEETLLNYGVWGPVPGDRKEIVRMNRLLEHKVRECGGKKWLYSHAYYTEEEFWAHYDRPAYDAVRERYGAGHLPSVFDKTRVDWEAEDAALKARPVKSRLWKIWPLAGLYGVYHAWTGADYLLQKQKGEAAKGDKA